MSDVKSLTINRANAAVYGLKEEDLVFAGFIFQSDLSVPINAVSDPNVKIETGERKLSVSVGKRYSESCFLEAREQLARIKAVIEKFAANEGLKINAMQAQNDFTKEWVSAKESDPTMKQVGMTFRLIGGKNTDGSFKCLPKNPESVSKESKDYFDIETVMKVLPVITKLEKNRNTGAIESRELSVEWQKEGLYSQLGYYKMIQKIDALLAYALVNVAFEIKIYQDAAGKTCYFRFEPKCIQIKGRAKHTENVESKMANARAMTDVFMKKVNPEDVEDAEDTDESFDVKQYDGLAEDRDQAMDEMHDQAMEELEGQATADDFGDIL